MSKKAKRILIILISIFICIAGLFIYEVKKEHHYTPQTAEILIEDETIFNDIFLIRGDTPVEFNLADHLTFVSDVEKGTVNLETRKKVFGFYECDINRVYDEYIPDITYKSSDENIAKIDENGIITALNKGQATITVTGDEISIDIPITVYKIVEVTEIEQDIVLLKGQSKSLINLDEYEIPFSEFSSSNEKVATVNQHGTVTAISKGKAEIYTYKDEAKTEKISSKITVKQPVESVSINKITIYIGDKATLKASYAPQNADYGTNFTYKSSDPSIATINGNVVSAVKAGEATITVTSGNGISSQAKLIVLSPPKATPSVTTISKSEYESYGGEKYSDGSLYASYFKISFDHPVIAFRINYVNDNFTSKTTGDAIYNNAAVPANTPLYFAICINQSDVIDTRGFSYVNKDGSQKFYSLHPSGKDGSVLMTAY